MPKILYTVTLTEEERDILKDISNTGSRAAYVVKRALVLLAVDRGEHNKSPCRPESEIADMLQITRRTISHIKQKFVEEGFDASLERSPQPSRGSKYDGDFEAHLTALACSNPPEGCASWSLRLLADKVVELNYVESVSHETIRTFLKKANLNLGKRKNG